LTEIPLRLGPLKAKGHHILRYCVRWLCEPGQFCRANQVVGYFKISVEPSGARLSGPVPFGEESDLQVAFAPRVDGRLRFDPASGPGGEITNRGFNLWDDADVLAHLEIDSSAADLTDDAGRLRLLMLAGRSMTDLIDVHSGFLPGWHSRRRGWWCEEGETPLTLLSMGICDVTGLIIGDQCAFLEMFRAVTAPSQFVFVADQPVSPSAPILLDQLHRTDAQFRAISADLCTGLASAGPVPTSADWIFAGSYLSKLQFCHIRETYDMLSPSGLTRSGPADAILLSLNAESSTILRHKTLGYPTHVMRHHQAVAGPAVRSWLKSAFEPVARTIDDIKSDYEKFIAAIEKMTGAHVIILNRMSTSGDENISSYAAFDSPLSSTLANIESKELNLMLHDLASNRNVSIVDVDAIAADIGGGEHLPDGVHSSRAMQDLLSAELLHILDGLRPEVEAATDSTLKSLQTQPVERKHSPHR
jgi:hypothetical protein